MVFSIERCITTFCPHHRFLGKVCRDPQVRCLRTKWMHLWTQATVRRSLYEGPLSVILWQSIGVTRASDPPLPKVLRFRAVSIFDMNLQRDALAKLREKQSHNVV